MSLRIAIDGGERGRQVEVRVGGVYIIHPTHTALTTPSTHQFHFTKRTPLFLLPITPFIFKQTIKNPLIGGGTT